MSTPSLITRAILAEGLVAHAAYRDLPEIQALGPSPDPSAVEQAIGRRIEMPMCDGCGDRSEEPRVRMGAEDDYESATAYLCEACARAALALFPARVANGPCFGWVCSHGACSCPCTGCSEARVR